MIGLKIGLSIPLQLKPVNLMKRDLEVRSYNLRNKQLKTIELAILYIAYGIHQPPKSKYFEDEL